ncbi:MAG: bifunctional 4-hydroxy-2-oxoglutarate aldolase/2-dehydro-3-deoxy-phosphogluconate aldolase [Synechococcus sp. MED-G135]|nr:MAG: bifunctional 4-hydroxy-2-oxoglutarate aldolase/2-dehydro-3-deoxy-phosphogluconate aldolase [Synechococcus sp. MED-G135]
MPNTSDRSRPDRINWIDRQHQLIRSLREQPFLVVLRPSPLDWSVETFDQAPLLCVINQLVDAGVHHIEIAWTPHCRWGELICWLRDRYPALRLGAASVTRREALEMVIDLGMAYAMSPCFDPSLLRLARRHGQLLVPGVFSPSEVQQAVAFGCELVKLFPAATVGINYLRQLSAPLSPLPCMIAAGGLTAADLDPWLAAGYHALALGRGLIDGEKLDQSLLSWLG